MTHKITILQIRVYFNLWFISNNIYGFIFFVWKSQVWLKCHILQFLRYLEVIDENHIYFFCLPEDILYQKKINKKKTIHWDIHIFMRKGKEGRKEVLAKRYLWLFLNLIMFLKVFAVLPKITALRPHVNKI